MNSLIYLACPYTDPDLKVMEYRLGVAAAVASMMVKADLFVFSPLSYGESITVNGNLPRTWEFWEKFDAVMVSKSGLLIVISIDGWEESVGVQAEIKLAKKYGVPVIIWPKECFDAICEQVLGDPYIIKGDM